MNLEITDRWLSVLDISIYLGISKEKVYSWLEAKKIPAHKIGKRGKLKIYKVDSWIFTSGENDNQIKEQK